MSPARLPIPLPIPLRVGAFLLAAGLVLAGCGGGADGRPGEAPAERRRAAPRAADPAAPPGSRPEEQRVETLEARVLAEYPHAPDAFTQGLLLHDGHLYESTGRRGQSSLRRVDPETGEVLVRRDLPARFFGEGLALVRTADGPRLIQLTWTSGVALVWDPETLEQVGEHTYSGQGWGLAAEPPASPGGGDDPDGLTPRLALSDGSAVLTFHDPETFAETGRVRVTMAGRPLMRLNELEWVGPDLWANVWGTSTIVRIDPEAGVVTGAVHLSQLEGRLPPEESRGIDVLNGIAYRPEGASGEGSFLLTGKLWPRLFEVVFESRRPAGG